MHQSETRPAGRHRQTHVRTTYVYRYTLLDVPAVGTVRYVRSKCSEAEQHVMYTMFRSRRAGAAGNSGAAAMPVHVAP